MSIQSEIDRINGNVASTYTALSEMGATMPETQNSDNLPGTVRTVPTGGGCVQTDWNQNDSSAADFIKNKPFGDMPTGGDTLYWDGNTDGKVIALDAYVHVSDVVLTKSDFANGAKIVVGVGLGVLTIVEEDVIEGAINGIGLAFSDAGFCLNETEAETVGFPAGTYFLCTNELTYVSSLTIPGYTGFPVTKKIEEKYLPGAVILYADNSLADGGYLYTSEDTSDTSKRMTKAELMEAIVGGSRVVIVCTISDVTAYLAPTMVGAPENYGMAIALVFGSAPVIFFTAEYVPETTE